MTIHVMCLTADGGLPIFTRKKGECENLPFSTVASLNGVHMFFKSMGVCMNSTIAEDWTLLWKDYESAITLIVCGRNMSEKKLELLSDLVFNSFKLFVNSEDLQTSTKIVDRLKREAKQYMPIVDRLLDSLATDILGFNDCILSTDNAHLLMKLNEFSVQCDSLFCCIVVNQKLAVGTEGWWDLDLIDRKLLITMLNSADRSQNDVPVYLPKKSSNTAYRFVSVPIAGCGILCVICGADPTYQEISNIAQNVFRNENEIMKSVERCISKNFLPETIESNVNVLEIVLLNKTTKKYVFLKNPEHSLSEQQYSILGQNSLENIRMYIDQMLETDENILKERSDENLQSIAVSCANQHWLSENHNCYAYCDEHENIFFVLFTFQVPVYAMKIFSEKIFAALMQERNICW
ncbi:protein fuzzy homolog [Episyrphus balteatus]|uniref:protein fuzzy homolog n=1 Tax=Episyrphus balteatus TaxID=286459 RepID=UPI002485C982|nr:protein fuzzy homolog [Episyrphus balteatus]